MRLIACVMISLLLAVILFFVGTNRDTPANAFVYAGFLFAFLALALALVARRRRVQKDKVAQHES